MDIVIALLTAIGLLLVLISAQLFKIIDLLNRRVVRCKDCKWFGGIGCAIQIVDDSDRPKEDDYCSFGERKEGLDV